MKKNYGHSDFEQDLVFQNWKSMKPIEQLRCFFAGFAHSSFARNLIT